MAQSRPESGQINVPGGLSGVWAIAAGWNYSLALVGTPGFQILNPTWKANTFSVSVASQNGSSYSLQYKSSPADSTWTSLAPVAGNGGILTLSDTSASSAGRFYRVSKQ